MAQLNRKGVSLTLYVNDNHSESTLGVIFDEKTLNNPERSDPNVYQEISGRSSAGCSPNCEFYSGCPVKSDDVPAERVDRVVDVRLTVIITPPCQMRDGIPDGIGNSIFAPILFELRDPIEKNGLLGKRQYVSERMEFGRYDLNRHKETAY